jgi:hypothetical protein
LRVLKPLKSVNTIPALKRQLDNLVKSLPNFLNVAAFFVFFYLLASLVGMHQYGEVFFNRCRTTPEPDEFGQWPLVETDGRICSLTGKGKHQCETGTYCGNLYDYDIPISLDDTINNENILFGIPSFNNIGTSLLLIN